MCVPETVIEKEDISCTGLKFFLRDLYGDNLYEGVYFTNTDLIDAFCKNGCLKKEGERRGCQPLLDMIDNTDGAVIVTEEHL